MDTSDCKASFSHAEMQRFLDERTMEALSKLQTEEELRKVTPLVEILLT